MRGAARCDGIVIEEVAGRRVIVNTIMPGVMDNGALKQVIAGRAFMNNFDMATLREAMTAEILAGRLGTAEDFGPSVPFALRHWQSTLPGSLSPSMAA